MSHYSESERRQVASLTELVHSQDIRVDGSEQGEFSVDSDYFDDAAQALEILGYGNVILSERLAACATRFSHLWCHWRALDEAHPLGGEFYLPAFVDAILGSSPELAWEGSSEDEKKLFSEWRVIDYSPGSGTGNLSAVRIRPDVDPLEIWHYGHRWGPQRMDVDYCGYLEALTLTKGTYGWQYLFTDTPLDDDAHIDHVLGLKAMLQLFPRIFPDHDYAPLRARLEARL